MSTSEQGHLLYLRMRIKQKVGAHIKQEKVQTQILVPLK